MNDLRILSDWLATVPELSGDIASIVPMQGGFNNPCFLVESESNQYVLRVSGNNEVFACDVERECRLQQQAAGHGLSASIIHCDSQRGLILMEYLPGKPWTRRDLEERDNLRQLAGVLRRLHELPPCDVIFNAGTAADRYLAQLGEGAARSPVARACLQTIQATPCPVELRNCHNDVVATNLIESDRLKLIDFEYACDNDPLFDLASVIGWHNLETREADWLLGAYAGGSAPELRERLQVQRRLFDALQWLWLAVRLERNGDQQLSRQQVVVADRVKSAV